MKQPSKNNLKDTLPPETFYTLLIDGNGLLETSMADPKTNARGEYIGGLFQFLLQLKILIKLRDFRHCYVFWDGELSGILRYNYYTDYKKNRDKAYSEYDRNRRDFEKLILGNKQKTEREIERDLHRESKQKQKEKIHEYLEELYIRQICDNENGTEADDLIAYYCLNKQPNEKIFIVSRDNDLTQLINEDVMIYQPTEKRFLHHLNFKDIKGYPIENVLIKKILCGDVSDGIKGIKGLGEKTLLDNFPEINKTPVTIDEIIEKAKVINENRINSKPKLKPLKWCENIINKVTDGIQGEKIYEINEKIINLKKPLLSDNAIQQMDEIMHAPLDPNDRDMKNLYKLIDRDDILDLKGENRFSGFFITFKKLIDNETEFYKKSV